MQIAILIFERLTALDAVGPYEVLSRLPDAEVRFVATETGPKRTDTGALALTADASLSEVPDPDIVLVPGGAGNRPLLEDEAVLGWLREAHEATAWTTSVCTGSLILGAAGILDGKRATSHWAFADVLRAFGAEPVNERFVEDGKVLTAAGVSAGVDMALHLAARIAGEETAQTIQLAIEYDPAPPFDTGSPAKAPPEMVERIRELSASDPSLRVQEAAGPPR